MREYFSLAKIPYYRLSSFMMRSFPKQLIAAVLLLMLGLPSGAVAGPQGRTSPAPTPEDGAEPWIGPILLTEEERAWLAEHPRIRSYFESWPPFLIDDDGTPRGITIDYLELICAELGLEVEYVWTEWTQALREIRSPRPAIDVLPILTHNAEREAFLHFTRDYVSFPIVIFSRKDSFFVGDLNDLRGHAVVVERDYAMHARLMRTLPDQPLIVVNTTTEALEEVVLGRAGAYLGNLAVGTYLIQERGFTNLKVAAPTPFGTHDQAMGVRLDYSVLAGLLDKGLEAVTPHGHHEIRQQWLAVRYEHGLTRADIWRWVLWVVAASGALLLLAFLRNRMLRREIGERRRAETALEESRSQLVEAQHLARVGSWSYHIESGRIQWSPETFRIVGRDPRLGEPGYGEHRDLVHLDDWETFDRTVRSACSSEGPHEVELRLRRSDGAIRYVICRAEPAPDRGEDGSVREVIGTFQDITERREAEIERERFEAQMRHTEKLKSLGVLAGGVAHDFNNILQIIQGNAQMAMLDLPESSEPRKSIGEVVQASRRAAELCRQMLAYSGQGTIEMKVLDLSSIAEGIARMLKASISKKATLHFDFAEDLPAVRADPTQMRQIVMNMITNASEALEEKSGFITLSTRACECDESSFVEAYVADDLPDGTYVVLEVSDDGCGMDEETRGRLFEPFFTTKFPGRGLGMAAVLGIVRAHRGAIQVQSEPGQGTTITLYLPAVDEPVPARPAREPALRPDVRASGTVLVADDEPKLLEMLERILSDRGFTVVTAADGREAVDIFRERAGEIACVVLDLTMPRMDGEETYLELRRLDAEIPVIIASGFHRQEVEQRFNGAGPEVRFIQKPFDINILVEEIEAVMGQVT